MRISIFTSSVLLALATSAAARPAPSPFNLGKIWNDIKETAANIAFKSTGKKQGCDADHLNDISYFAEYAAAAYCDPNHIPGKEVECPDNICPTITKRKVTTIIEFSEGKADTTGIVVRDDDAKYIIVAYRGSRSIKNWISNFAMTLFEVPAFCKECRIHKGFYEAYLEVKDKIWNAVQDQQKQYPGYKLVTVGHSLGGAVAQITATDFRVRGKQVTAYSFGSPRLGNKALSSFISNSGVNFRVTHLDDPVPRLPLLLQGYTHITPEYHIFRGDVNIRPQDINILDGFVNFGGNTAADGLVSLNVSAHLRYVTPNWISGCAKGLFEI